MQCLLLILIEAAICPQRAPSSELHRYHRLIAGSACLPAPKDLLSQPTICLSLLVTFLGEGVEEGKLGLGEGASGRGTGRFLGAPTVKEEIQGLLGRAGWRGVR